ESGRAGVMAPIAPWMERLLRQTPSFLGLLEELEVGKARRAIEEAQVDRANGTVPVLGDDELGDALLVGVLIVVLVAVDEHHDVGVLLDRAGFAEVRKHRAMVRTGFDGARELGQGNDRDVELAGKALESTGDLRDLLHAVVRAP